MLLCIHKIHWHLLMIWCNGMLKGLLTQAGDIFFSRFLHEPKRLGHEIMINQIWSGRYIQSGLRVHQNHFQVDSVQGEIISALTQPKLNAFCVDSACSECEA
jgi:hypothetical protein